MKTKQAKCGGYVVLNHQTVSQLDSDYRVYNQTTYMSVENAKSAFKILSIDGRSKGGNTRRDWKVAYKY